MAHALAYGASNAPEPAGSAQETGQVIFQNVSIFDGKNEKLNKEMSVLVEGYNIAKMAIHTGTSRCDGDRHEGQGPDARAH